MSSRVVLDACVLVPYNLASLLLTLAEQDVFEARWSETILDEVHRTLTGKLNLDPVRASRRCDAMRRAFPEAEVADAPPTLDGLKVDPKDRHVLATAIASASDIILTFNLDDFPESACEPYGVLALHPEHFLLELLAEESDAILAALVADADRRSNPPVEPADILARLARILPTFANMAHQVVRQNEAVGDLPAYVIAGPADSPLASLADGVDLTDPLHVAALWWTALLEQEEYEDQLLALTHAPRAWGDYRWAADMLKAKSMASNVYYAVDDPTNVAVVRFVPEVAETVQAFAAFIVRGVVFLTLRRQPDGTWRAWGLGPVMVPAHTVTTD